jgi:4-carboxymuconolactone decarboxylase
MRSLEKRRPVSDDARFDCYAAELDRAVIAALLVTIGNTTSVSLAMSLHALEPMG